MKKLNALLIFAVFLFVTNSFAAVPNAPTNISGPLFHCSGTSETYTVSQTGGANGFSWVASGAQWSVASSTTSGTFNGITAGPESGTISVWAFNGDGNSGTFTKEIQQLGTLGMINEPGGFHCTGASKTYSVDPVIQAENYHWSISPSSWTITPTTDNWAVVYGGTGYATLSVYADNQCESTDTVSTLIIPNPPPDEILATLSGPHCPNSSNTYTVLPVVGATSYSWYLESDDPGWTFTPSITTAFVVSSGTATTGPATIYVASNNVCGSSATISRTINPFGGPDAISVSPPGGHCVNTTKTYSVTPIEHADSYGWRFVSNSQWSASSSTTSSISVTSGSITTTSATLSVWAVNDCGTSSTFTKVIAPTYSPTPPTSFYTNTTHCSGTSMTYGVTPVSNADYYGWNVNNPSWSVLGTNNVVSVMAGTGSATLTVSAINNCGISAPIALAVSPWTVPSTATITKPSHHCYGDTVSYGVSTNPFATSYTWYIKGAGWQGTSTTGLIDIIAGAGSGTISVVAHGPCGSSATYTTTMSPSFLPEKPDQIYTPPNHCEGQIKTYACTPVAGAVYYTWSVQGNGWSGTSSTNYIDLMAGSAEALISVRANTECGGSADESISVTPGITPRAAVGIGKPGRHCIGAEQTYSSAPIPGATEYTWQLSNPSGGTPWSITAMDGLSINLITGTGSATLTVYGINHCGTGAGYSETIAPNTLPTQPGAMTGPDSHCEGSAQEYSVTEVPGASSYVWSVSGTGWSTAPSNTKECDITAGSGQGIISVRAINACGQGLSRTKTVTPNTLPATPTGVNKPSVHCAGMDEDYVVVPVSGATSYEWSVLGNNWTGSGTGTTFKVKAGLGDATITVKAKNACGEGPTFTTNSSATPLPSSAFSIDRDTICKDESVTVAYTGNAGAGATYAWTFDGGTATPGSGKGPHTVKWISSPGAKTVRLIVTENGCPSQERLVSVFVDNCLDVSDDNENGIKIELLPNPSNGLVSLRISNSPYVSAGLKVVNTLGQEVYFEQLSDIKDIFTKEINLPNLVNGNYYVKVAFNDIEIVRRLVIIK